ncbi:hypothetical protein FB451DRAFT_1181837 [Mycena latifolia]|nr:hypothetical protein FB451DRAFT_1181837 [Mycena latifolia]
MDFLVSVLSLTTAQLQYFATSLNVMPCPPPISRAPNSHSRSNSATAAPATPLPTNATPADVAASGYPDKSPAKGKTPISSLHFNKTPSNTYSTWNQKHTHLLSNLPVVAGSSVKGKACAFATAHPNACSSNSFEPLSALEEHITEEIIVADLIGVPIASMVGGGSISSLDLSHLGADNVDAAMRLRKGARTCSCESLQRAFLCVRVPVDCTPPIATAKLLLSPFLDPAEDAPSPSTTATGTPAGSPSTATTASAPVGATNPATMERTTAPAACTTAAATDTSMPMLPAVALLSPALKALPSVTLANLKESLSNDLAADMSSTGAPLAPTPSASTLAPATAAPQAVTSSAFPQATPDPDGTRAAAANDEPPPSQAARARADRAVAQLLASIALWATMPSIVQPAVSLPRAAAAGATLSFAAAVTAPRPTTCSQMRGVQHPSASTPPTSLPSPTMLQPTAQPAALHASGAAATTAHANTANPTLTALPPTAANANMASLAPSAAPTSPAPGATPASAVHMSAVNPAPGAAPAGTANTNAINPAPGTAPTSAANANTNAVIHAPIGTAAVAAPVGNTVTLYTTPPPASFHVYGWDEKTVRESISDHHLAKWDAPSALKAFVYEWNAKCHNPMGTTVEDIKTTISHIFGCPAPLVGPAEPAVASATSGGPYVYLMKGLTTAQFQALVDALCWSVASGKTLFVIPYSPIGHETIPLFYGNTACKNGYVPIPSAGLMLSLTVRLLKGVRSGAQASMTANNSTDSEDSTLHFLALPPSGMLYIL